MLESRMDAGKEKNGGERGCLTVYAKMLDPFLRSID